MIFGGIVYLPKKADLSQEITIRHEGPVNQLLIVEIPKLPEYVEVIPGL